MTNFLIALSNVLSAFVSFGVFGLTKEAAYLYGSYMLISLLGFLAGTFQK